MATSFRPWDVPGDYGTHYHFDSVGDGIPMHAHLDRATWHTTRCLKGSVAIYGDGIDLTLEAGDSAYFPPYRMHEIVALEAHSEIVNVFTYGKPEGHLGSDPACLTGSLDSILHGRDCFSDSTT